MELVTDLNEPDWDKFIDESVSYDVYHTAGYHRLAEWNGEGRPVLFVHESADARFALPLLIRELPHGEPGFDATSVYGYAGPTCSTAEPDAGTVAGFQRELTVALRDLGVVSVFSRLHPYIDPAPVEGLGEVTQVSEVVSLDLSLESTEAQAGYRKSHRRTLRRTVKAGVRCEHDAALQHLDALSDIYAETMERTNANASLRFGDEYFYRMAAELPDEVVHLVCFDEHDEIVGASIYLRTDGFLNAHLGGSRGGMGLISPATLETDFARQWGTDAGLEFLNLGGGVGGADDSLLNFKRGFSKSLAPFRVWRWIVDSDRYRQLSGPDRVDSGFFPAYRSGGASVAKDAGGTNGSDES